MNEVLGNLVFIRLRKQKKNRERNILAVRE